MTQKIAASALILGCTAIIFGAFGAHSLKEILTESQIDSFETGVKYQMYSALFLLFISLTNWINESSQKIIWRLALIGTMLFSGSIYLLTVGPHFGINIQKFGFITPIGGLLMILAWIVAAFKTLIQKK